MCLALLQMLYIYLHSESSQRPCGEHCYPHLTTCKLRHRALKGLAQGHQLVSEREC